MTSLLPTIFPVTCHTDHVGPGSTFVAIKGFTEDGNKYIQVALEKGATTIIAQEANEELQKICDKYNADLKIASDIRKALAEASNTSTNNAWKQLKIIGITGTKGKTTTAYLTEYLLRSAGYKTALISTIVNRILDQEESSKNTTPESDYLHIFFAECVKRGIEYVVMEVSSHALSLHRVHGIKFCAVGFLNLSPDHLDFHNDIQDYLHAKTQIFCHVNKGGSIVINTEHEWGEQVLHEAFVLKPNGVPVLPLQLSSITTNTNGVSCNVNNLELHTASLFGDFNAYNMGIAAQLCLLQDIDPQTITQSLAQFPGVPGRLQQHILKNGARAFVDYAHNAFAVHGVLNTLRQQTSHLIVVFGCGGNRDKGRRPGMGAAAAAYADVIILTNDNPRFEDPEVIIDDIIAGIPEEKRGLVIRQSDRAKAIATAACMAQENSIIALLGKGHEDYYSIQGIMSHFDDFDQICKF